MRSKPAQIAAPGVAKLGPFGPYKNSVWVFYHNGEAAVAEMPPYRKSEQKPWNATKKFLKDHGLRLKYGLLSHLHVDHCQSLPSFRKAFPEADFVAHRSYLHSRLAWRLGYEIGLEPDEVFDIIYDGDVRLLDLGGEPLLLIFCPKHSPTDQFVIFRGTAMTGDWFLGDLKDCNALVLPEEKIRSADRVQTWLSRLDYRVARAFSGHGDHLYYGIDFDLMMEESKIDHGPIG